MDDAPPPSYDQAVGSSNSNKASKPPAQDPSHLTVDNGVTPQMRQSMEDEGLPLPTGWVRSFDERDHHQFFVDTTVDPPRSIWHHPYHDETYLNSVSSKEKERIKDLLNARHADRSDDESHDNPHQSSGSNQAGSSTAAAGANTTGEKPSFGRRWKDKLTNSTHEERVAMRQKQAQEEAQYFERHRQIRAAMVEASRSGQPQFIGKDPRTGQDIYIEPPNGPQPPIGSRGVNPFSTGVYQNPNNRFIRPDYGYDRPYGTYGYGGGSYNNGYYGRGGGFGGAGLGLAGGLFGGLLLGEALGGF